MFRSTRKIYMGITSVALITLGIICICAPLSTISSLTWVIGVVALISGTSTLLNWLSLRKFFIQSGSIFFSGLMQVIFGIVLLKNGLEFAKIIGLVLGVFLLFEGINVAIRSFEYKLIHFRWWWVNTILGISTATLGFFVLVFPELFPSAVGICLGIGFIFAGLVYLIAMCAANNFDKKLRKDPWIDEQ